MSEPDDEPFHKRLLRDRRLFGGVAVACAAGLAFGLLMKPQLSDEAPKQQPSARVAQIPTEPEFTAPPPVVRPLPVQPVIRASAPEPEPEEADERPVRRFTSRPSFDCDYARTRSEEMICSDRRLAAADRRMARAYARAARAGVPHRVLRSQQDAWLRAREDAAHDDPRAVEEVYEARIAELRDLAYEDY